MSEYKPTADQEGVSLPSDTSPTTHLPSVSEQMVRAGVEMLYQLDGDVSKATLVRELYRAMEAARLQQ